MTNSSPSHPLAEVFGFPTDNFSPSAQRARKLRLCPYNNKSPNCTKDKANAPLGVCSIFERNGKPAITCPVRFRENWLIAEHAAQFFFPEDSMWTSLTEVRLLDANRQSAGNIDVVLVSYDEAGRLLDFGAVEVQAVYISGNVRRPFEQYMQNPEENANMLWKGRYPPRPDYLSSSRKRLAPQLLYKGGILKTWEKKQAVVIHRGFWDTLPALPEVSASEADIAWLIYDLERESESQRYHLKRVQSIYTAFQPALERLTKPTAGPLASFMQGLQDKLNQKLDAPVGSPDTVSLNELFEQESQIG